MQEKTYLFIHIFFFTKEFISYENTIDSEVDGKMLEKVRMQSDRNMQYQKSDDVSKHVVSICLNNTILGESDRY